MPERDENFKGKEDKEQESAFEVTELDDQDLEDASGGEVSAPNTNCYEC